MLPNEDRRGESRGRRWTPGKEKLWGSKILEGDILREMLSVTNHPPKRKTSKVNQNP